MLRTLSPEEYQEIGKSYYKLKQYEKAIEAFTNGIEASIIPSATLYDYRAASYEKLADFNSAVKDGRLAIRTHKQDVKGYLRTASALQKLNKLDTALNIYKYGMKNVPVDNKDFQLLQQLHDKLTRKLSPPKAIDPFTILPVELVEMVIGYLSFKNMVNCLRVSKGWKNYLTKRPKLWANLDLSGATRPVSRTFLRNAVKHSQNILHTLIAHRIQHVDILCNIATACKSLHTLTILSFPHMLSDSLIEMAQCAQNLRYMSVHTEISLYTVSQILRRRPELKYVEFKDVSYPQIPVAWEGAPLTNLQTISIQGSGLHPPQIAQLMMLAQKAPGLRSLTYVRAGLSMPFMWNLHETSLTELVLTKVDSPCFPRLPSTLKRFVYHPVRSQLGHDDIAAAAASCTRTLTHLTLGDNVSLYPRFLETLLDFYTDEGGSQKALQDGESLQHLSLSGDLSSENLDGTLSMLASAPPRTLVSTYLSTSSRILTRSLTSLELPGLPLTDDDIGEITAPTSLTSIDVSNTRISGFGIKQLVDRSPTLRHIKADHCRNLSSRDAIDYAEKKHVHVSYTMAEPGVKGRKVRYG